MELKSCPVCLGEQASELGISHAEVSLYRCKVCQHCFTDVSSIQNPETYSPEYYDVIHKNWFENPNFPLFEKILKIILKNKSEKASVLDVGCGRGDFLKYLRQQSPGLDLSGIDFSKTPSIEGVTLDQGDFFEKNFQKQFDVVVSLAAIEHVEDVQRFTKRLAALCSPQGLIIVMTVNEGGMIYGAARGLASCGIKGPFERLYSKHHLNHFSVSSLNTLMQKCGLEVMTTIQHHMPLKAVDIPSKSDLEDKILRLGVGAAFLLGEWLELDFMQTIVCRKEIG